MERSIFGYVGKLLRVNLTSGELKSEPLDISIAEQYLGGRGYAAKLLYDNLPPKIDPLSPQNILIYMTGPLTGTAAPTSARFTISTKSPLTGLINDSSIGGYMGPAIKRAGFDGFIFEGKSPKPVYLFVNEGKAELIDASEIWGKTVYEAAEYLREKHGNDIRIAIIGPAGENMVRFASIMIDEHRAAGRGGTGAVMGSKNLKAVVVKGRIPIKVANKFAFLKIVKNATEVLKGHPVTGTGLERYGTGILTHLVNKSGVLPVRNFQDASVEDAEPISGEYIHEKMLIKAKGCYGCPIRCDRLTEVREGKFKGLKVHGPEYETIWAFGPNLDNMDIGYIAKANDLCDALGMDTITMGAVMAFLMEAKEKGKIPSNIAKDLDINWGDMDKVLELIEDTAFRRGIGNYLAEGSKRLSEEWNAPGLAMHSKGLELPAYDPRGIKGMALSYAVSNKGGDHLRAYIVASEIGSMPRYLDPNTTEGKAELVKRMQDVFAVIDSIGLCKYTSFAFFDTLNYEAEIYAKMVTTATGFYFDEKIISEVGERIYNIERLFNIREGFTYKDDTLPERFKTDPIKHGPAQGKTVDVAPMVLEYYKVRGWTPDGIPMEKTLSRLGIKTPEVNRPMLQVALDLRSLDEAMKIAEKCHEGGIDIIEAGTPLIKQNGMDAVRQLRKKFPNALILADLKTMDTGWLETEIAAQAGADIVAILGVADDGTIKDAVGAARKYGVKIMIDMINHPDPIGRAKEVEKLGVDIVAAHVGISKQMREREINQRVEEIKKLVKAVNIPVSVAGGIRLEAIPALVRAGVKIIVVGGAITRSSDPGEATRMMKDAIIKTYAEMQDNK